MNYYRLHQKAETEWHGSMALRQQYPTFAFYWYERYERIYDIPAAVKTLFRLYHGKPNGVSLESLTASMG